MSCLEVSQARRSQVERAHAPFWTPPPHYSTEDFVYNGMYIPKNTALILNCYGIHHNEERYPDPYAPTILHWISFNTDKCVLYGRFSFVPERFLGDSLTCAESSNLPNAMDRDHWAFGAGYVSCFVAITDFLADILFKCAAAAAFVRVFTSRSGSCGSQSHGCFGLLTSDRCLTSLSPSKDMTALHASRNHFASPSHRDMIECRHCLRRKRKFR